jgi:hypothetical protein
MEMVSELLQQELQVLRERNILRLRDEEVYGESFLTHKKLMMSLNSLMKKYLGLNL